MAIPQDIQASIEREYHCKVLSASPLGGGCIHDAHRIATSEGRFFLKYNSLDHANNFSVEAKGLNLLRETNTISIPEVRGTHKSDHHAFLILELVETGVQSSNYWEDFGRELANLHKNHNPFFGLEYDNYIGALPQNNSQNDSWPDFFISARIEPMLKMARDRKLVDYSLIRSFDALFSKLETLFPTRQPSLIHGDLWGGNILTNSNGQATLIDPAVYFGHHEIELSFMQLFDRQPSRFWESYQSVLPIETGFSDRIDLYNLYPLLVHLNLFGESYLGGIRQTIKRFVP